MAMISMHKDFVVKEEKVFEQLKKDVEKKIPLKRSAERALSLEKGKEKLKQFSFRKYLWQE